MKRRLGRQEAQMLAYLQMRRQRTVRTGELTGPLGLTRLQERELFRRMARAKLIARVRPGLYLVPERLPFGGSWSPDEALALKALMDDRQGRYQICGPNAFNRYGLDEQLPNRVYAYNDRISGKRVIGSIALTLIKVAEGRLGAVEKVRTADGLTLSYSSRARTLVDAVNDWSRFNTLPRAFDWIRKELSSGRVQPAELVRTTLRYGEVGSIRRIGALLDREDVSPSLLRTLEKALKPSQALIPWIPTRPKRGTVDRCWGVVWNESA
ncbi:MAG: type IV toxin-antitoxin system AbiEi family antitoxin domain-containing protein [Thermoanaerobaculia bacterium]